MDDELDYEEMTEAEYTNIKIIQAEDRLEQEKERKIGLWEEENKNGNNQQQD